MINSRELRLFNWVEYKMEDGSWFPLEIAQLSISDLVREHIRPIPLTPEILLSVGFELTKDKFHNRYRKVDGRAIYEFCIREQYGIDNANCGIMGIAYDEEDIDMGDGTTYHQEYSWNGFAWRIKYLHQLQNLYFALTGQELIYKP